MNIKVAIGQFEITPANVEKNLKKGMNLIKEAKSNGCNLILLPEVWTTGFPFKQLKELARSTDDVLNEIKKLSQDICICGSYVVDNPENSKVFNIFHAIYNGDIIFSYKKIMLFRFTVEDKFFDPGNTNQENTFEAFGVRMGVSICYELRFPEFFRMAAFNGALIHLVPAMWPKPRCRHWQIISETRAIENQIYVITCNGSKSSGKWNMCGLSSVFDPWGETLISLNDSFEGIQTIDLDLEKLKSIRDSFPAFDDSKEHFYGLYKKEPK